MAARIIATGLLAVLGADMERLLLSPPCSRIFTGARPVANERRRWIRASSVLVPRSTDRTIAFLRGWADPCVHLALAQRTSTRKACAVWPRPKHTVRETSPRNPADPRFLARSRWACSSSEQNSEVGWPRETSFEFAGATHGTRNQGTREQLNHLQRDTLSERTLPTALGK